MFQAFMTRRTALFIALMAIALSATLLFTAPASAAPALYEVETSAGRVCQVAVDAEIGGGFSVLRHINFDTVLTCDEVAGQPSPYVGSGMLRLLDTLTQGQVVFGNGDRSIEYGYTCLEVDSVPCVDQGRSGLPLAVPGNYYAESTFYVVLEGEGETWVNVPEGCILLDNDTILGCAFRSDTVSIGILP